MLDQPLQDRVKVDGYDGLGTVRFAGDHKTTGKPRVGVELDRPLGKHDGTTGGNKYFVCPVRQLRQPFGNQFAQK